MRFSAIAVTFITVRRNGAQKRKGRNVEFKITIRPNNDGNNDQAEYAIEDAEGFQGALEDGIFELQCDSTWEMIDGEKYMITVEEVESLEERVCFATVEGDDLHVGEFVK